MHNSGYFFRTGGRLALGTRAEWVIGKWRVRALGDDRCLHGGTVIGALGPFSRPRKGRTNGRSAGKDVTWA
jgi:hypothetical protein